MTYRISDKRLLDREFKRLHAWCDRRDAVFALYRAAHREEGRKIWAEIKVFWRAIRGTE